MPDLNEGDQENEVDRAFAEFLQRCDAGEAVDAASFLGEHGELSTELGELLETARLIEQMAGPAETEPGETDAPHTSETVAGIDVTQPVRPGTEQTQAYVGKGGTGDESALSLGAGSSPRQFGEYQLLEELGRGGMGVVYKARQTKLNRTVAVKMILSGHWASGDQIDRFYTEAKAAGKLSHPNIVKVYQVGEVDGHHFFSMEYVEGQSLSQVLRGGALSPMQAARYLKHLADAVHYAHEHQILHRDLKPSNILVDASDQPRITDFGLARDVEDDEERLTATGAALGTPSYMSPEQTLARHEEVGRGSDIYSLGAILYEMLTGKPPFGGDSIADTILNVIHTEPAAPRTVDKTCDRELEAVCLKCLHKNPAHRYGSANELADDLDRFLLGVHVLARRASWHRRVWQWLRDVPLISAIVGRKMSRPTVWHKRLQATVLLLPLAVVAGLLAKSWIEDTLQYGRIDVATGETFHTYHQLASELEGPLERLAARPVELHSRAGSVANRASLLDGEDDLAVIQENVIADAGDLIQILAPLYYETILIIVRKNSGIATIQDLAGRSIALGAKGSGMRQSAEGILRKKLVDLRQVASRDSHWTELATRKELDGAIITIKLDNTKLHELLETGEFTLVPIHNAEQLIPLTSTMIDPNEVPAEVGFPGPVPTAQTMAVLAVRADAPNWFVTTCLRALYDESEITMRFDSVFSREEAANLNSNLHPAARRFFAQSVPAK